MNRTLLHIFKTLLGMAVLVVYSTLASAEEKHETASDHLKKKCIEKMDLKSCEKVNSFCKKNDSEACSTMAVYWHLQGDNEVALSFAKKSCNLNNINACKASFKLSELANQQISNKKRSLAVEQKIADIERERDDRNAAYQMELQQRQRQQSISTGLMMMGNMINAPPQYLPQNSQPIRCQTTSNTQNGFYQSDTTYSTECK